MHAFTLQWFQVFIYFDRRESGGKVAADMTSRAVDCLQCGAPLALADGQRHCQCAHCASKFVVDWSDGEVPRFVGFESLLARGLDKAAAKVTEERLTELDRLIPEAEEQVLASREDLEEARLTYRARRADAQTLIEPPQNWTYVAGLLALVAWFLVWFVLENMAWYVLLLIAILLIFVTWAFYRRWQDAELWTQSQLQEVRRTAEQAEADLNEASARLEDQTLERELHQMEVASYRQEDEPPSPEGAKETAA
jgi:hypothetical protein